MLLINEVYTIHIKTEKKPIPRKERLLSCRTLSGIAVPKVPNDMHEPYRSECHKHALTNLFINVYYNKDKIDLQVEVLYIFLKEISSVWLKSYTAFFIFFFTNHRYKNGSNPRKEVYCHGIK